MKATYFLSESELFKYTSTFNIDGDGLESYIFSRLNTGAIVMKRNQLGILPALAYDHALFYKGFLLNAVARIITFTMFAPESNEISFQLKGYRRQLAFEYSKPILDRKGVTELEDKSNVIEKELARTVGGYREAIKQVNWHEVQQKLKTNEAAIEFVHYRYTNKKPTDSIMYSALIVKPESIEPIFISLFEEKSLDSLLNTKTERKADYVNNLYTLADRGARPIESPIRSLYEILWQPMEKELVGVKKIYYSPTGLLHRINLDAIARSSTKTLADQYQLIELNSTRELVIPSQVKIANNEAVLFGGIQYDQDSSLLNPEPLITSRSRGELSFKNVDSTLRGGSWNYLPGTEDEVNTIGTMMMASGLDVKTKKGYQATEESFKNIGANNSPSPKILHIASHGYFFPDPKSTSNIAGFENQKEPVFKMSEHPMLRSGLILAGGNAAWQGKQTLEGREDGVLTAYEISQMNLSNTELVVLSACETGLGEIQGNEGVYGLQRAFKIAGAKYIIMSLWQVPDKQTSLLMTTFYKKWLKEKMTIPDAFQSAQKELRNAGLDPYQWAGFILCE
ncbi:MAG: CHAT domain-containing protein [Saprospiraceae bacterium]|uniref:CHAT domain-containing protein n=1 Tax=Candidatus Defluviibacterium haderslevense TaxID=2981993 RepID=A0A9D7SBL8_9BACT|nr:CHAT domain-containing protein [Candidatus Defluviibacterium haderslevense]